MINASSLFVTFGDVIELGYPSWDVLRTEQILSTHSDNWRQYNPRKSNNRYGMSVTSIDGNYSGIPDLDSLLEYNAENKSNYHEKDFSKRTSIVDDIPELSPMLDDFDPIGRCHFLRIDSGGFFPPHRDNGPIMPAPTFRIIVPLQNTNKHQWKWIQEDKLLPLQTGRTYCINTSKEHSVFSFVDNCCMLVMNVPATVQNCLRVSSNMLVQ